MPRQSFDLLLSLDSSHDIRQLLKIYNNIEVISSREPTKTLIPMLGYTLLQITCHTRI